MENREEFRVHGRLGYSGSREGCVLFPIQFRDQDDQDYDEVDDIEDNNGEGFDLESVIDPDRYSHR